MKRGFDEKEKTERESVKRIKERTFFSVTSENEK